MDIEQFSLIVMQQVKAYVQPAIDALAQRIDERESAIIAALDKKLGELPVAESIQVAAPDIGPFCEEIRAMVEAIPVPVDGKSVTLEEVRPMLADEVAKAVAALPVPRDGDSVTLDQVRPLIDAAVQALPPASPGKNADPVDMAVVAELIKQAVDAIPVPEHGKDADPEVVRDMIVSTVKSARDSEPDLTDHFVAALSKRFADAIH